ncbi:MAG: galactose-1-phosphate uridylyltransferase, partial [Caldisericum exile]
MPELRRDPTTGKWVIIATERALRPTDFKSEEEALKGPENCPFCEG